MAFHHVPPQPTPFIGRETELAQIAQLLADPDCHLLNLVGPGGIGKTRLAVQSAAAFEARYRDGIFFIALAPLVSVEQLIPTLANGLGFQFFETRDPLQQLLDYLNDKHLLLVLDNFEPLLEGAELLARLLAAASQVNLLITSRERLNLVEEWGFEVGGLLFPANEDEADIEPYSAVQLFVSCAKRAQAAFTVTAAQKPAINRICRLAGGMPLAIELAATWVRALSCEAIAAELERSLDVLETPARNVSPRYRNIRAAFEPTWERLGAAERTVFARLSVFRGGFTLEAAQAVAGADRHSLSTLVDKSLLQLDSTGRYSIHELLRQYGEERLKATPQEDEQAQAAHCAFYSDALNKWSKQMPIEVF